MRKILKKLKKYISKKKISFNSFVALTSLLIALVSMMIAINSLVISEKVYLFSSKDYLPELEFEFVENGLKLTNKTNDLFVIEGISVLKINELGFFNNNESTYIQAPFVRISESAYIYDFDGVNKEFTISFNDPNPCAFICPFDEAIFNQIQTKINEECSIESEKCFAGGGLDETFYIVDIGYSDKFNNYKDVKYKYVHSHGYGEWHKVQINDEELNDILDQANIPEMDSFEEQWEYLIKNYKKEF